MTERIETVIVGAGQAGLATSYHLTRLGREHVVLEQAPGPGNAWRSDRWDSFTLNTPNWAFRLPGAEYQGDAPDGFMPRAEIVARFERYAASLHASIRYGVRVQSVELGAGRSGASRYRAARRQLDNPECGGRHRPLPAFQGARFQPLTLTAGRSSAFRSVPEPGILCRMGRCSSWGVGSRAARSQRSST